MALSTPTLVTPTVSVFNQTLTTAAFTPTAGALLVVHVGVLRNTTLPVAPTISGTGGLTWTQLTDPIDGLFDTGSGMRCRALVWAATVGGSPGSQTITGASTGALRLVIMVQQITGQSGIPSNAKAAANANGDPTITLNSAPDAASTVLAFLTGAATTAGATTPAGFTQLDNNTDGAQVSWHCCYDAASPPTSVAYTSTYTASVGTAVEVPAAGGGGGGTVSGVPFRPSRRFSHMLIR